MWMWVSLVISVVGVLAGVVLTWRGLFGDRSRGQPRCPRCWYSMRGLSELRCPECGRVLGHERQLYRTRRHWRTTILALTIAVGVPLLCYHGHIPWRRLLPRWRLIQLTTVGPAQVRIYRDRHLNIPTGPSRLEIRIGGDVAYVQGGWLLELGAGSFGSAARVGVGEDITGDGQPNLVIHEFTGGAHCCDNYTVLELSGGVTTVARLDTGDGGGRFEDLDGDGVPEFVLADDTFDYWNECHAASPMPEVILRYRRGRYIPALELMRRPPPEPAKLADDAAAIANDPGWPSESQPLPSSRMWATMLELIYSGNRTEAWRYFDLAWPDDRSGKSQFRVAFLSQLAHSPYWPEIERMNFTASPTTLLQQDPPPRPEVAGAADQITPRVDQAQRGP